MDDAKTNSPEIQTTEAGTPKPPVITTIETNQQAHIKWCQDEAGNYTDILNRQKGMVYDNLSPHETGMNSLFNVQNRAALDVRDERTAVEEARVEAEKVKADELITQTRAEADRLVAEAKAPTATPIKGPAIVMTPPQKGFLGRLFGR